MALWQLGLTHLPFPGRRKFPTTSYASLQPCILDFLFKSNIIIGTIDVLFKYKRATVGKYRIPIFKAQMSVITKRSDKNGL